MDAQETAAEVVWLFKEEGYKEGPRAGGAGQGKARLFPRRKQKKN